MRPGNAEVVYREEQSYEFPWPGILIVLSGALTFAAVIVPFSYAMWQQLVMGVPWGDRPLPDAALMVVAPGAIVFGCVPFIVLFDRLTIAVSAEAIVIRQRIKAGRVIPMDRIAGVELASLRAWDLTRGGIRQRDIFRMQASDGIALSLTDGRRVLVASNRPGELLRVVRSLIASAARRASRRPARSPRVGPRGMIPADMDAAPTPPSPRPGLVRAIGRWDLTAAIVNGVIGSAIFGMPAVLARADRRLSPLVAPGRGRRRAHHRALLRRGGEPLPGARAGPTSTRARRSGRSSGFQAGWLTFWIARHGAGREPQRVRRLPGPMPARRPASGPAARRGDDARWWASSPPST